jgi:hypothetical protein
LEIGEAEERARARGEELDDGLDIAWWELLGFIDRHGGQLGAWAKQSKTGRCWAFSTGYLLRSAAEFFVVGTHGRPVQLSRSSRNLIVAPVRGHSVWPDEMYELIEATWPGPYVELFARSQHQAGSRGDTRLAHERGIRAEDGIGHCL